MPPRNPQTEIVSVNLGEKRGVVKFQAIRQGAAGGDAINVKKVFSFKAIADAIEGLSDALTATLDKVGPSKASIEFGVLLTVGTDGLAALFVDSELEANLKVTLEWERNSAKKDNEHG